MRKTLLTGTILLIALFYTNITKAQVHARMFRYPDVSQTQITFVYAGNVWVAPKEGGLAKMLTTPKGEEEFPRFSPDGRQIAYSADYAGNMNVYVVPADGGTARQITHDPTPDRVLGWYPNGKQILYASSKQSGRQRFNQLYKVSDKGGLSGKLPVPYGEFGMISPDGKWLAFTMKSRAFRHWKGYRGGWAPDIWLFNLKTYESKNITHNKDNDEQPMWHGDKIYYRSDAGPNERYNIWVYDLKTGKSTQVTHFKKFDVHFPSVGPDDIVFEAHDNLYLLDLNTNKYHAIHIRVVTDNSTLMPHIVDAAKWIRNAAISPKGKRVLFEARGDIFSVPAQHGDTRDLTQTSAYAERMPEYSPNGKYIAYWSDQTGEYELTLRKTDGSGKPETLTSFKDGFQYHIFWSPDSKKIAYVNNKMDIQVYDLATHAVTTIDKGQWLYNPNLESYRFGWSPDSQWLAYYKGLGNRHNAIFLYNTKTKQKAQVTSGYYSDSNPVFSPDGKYLYFFTNQHFRPDYSSIDETWIYPNTTEIAAVSLRSDVPSVLAPRNDTVEVSENGKSENDHKESAKKDDSKNVTIQTDGIESRMVILPVPYGNYRHLQAVSGKVLFQKMPRTGSGESESPLQYYDIKARKVETILKNVSGYSLSANREKILVRQGRTFAIVNVAANQKMDKTISTSNLQMTVDPRAEWHQIFNDVWRFERDYYYDPYMNDVGWDAMRKKYEPLINDCVTRWDVNYVIGQLLGEINSSHTYVFGGDTQKSLHRSVGLLGINWRLDHGKYQIAKIIKGATWDVVRSPLDQPGLDVKTGDYILAVNGTPINTSKDPYAAFEGLAKKTVILTVNSKPTFNGAHTITVKTLASEAKLRHEAWVEAKRDQVDRETNGQIGYIYVPDTGIGGQTDLVRQFNAQYNKKGLIIDERFNSGGQIPNRFIELLARKPLAFWAVRDGTDWQTPTVANFGPKVMLINGWSGSGGDAFPYFFREDKLGKLIGRRTWGGLIGYVGVPPLIDGGEITVPCFRLYNPQGKWFPEGIGVKPDIRVVNDPTSMAKGEDPQLEKGIQEELKSLKDHPFVRPQRPPYPNRSLGQHN